MSGSARPAGLPDGGLSNSARVYLRPVGLVGGGAAAAMVAAGSARPLAGGPLAFTGCEVCIRDAGRIDRVAVSLSALDRWAERIGGRVEARVALLLDRISGPRADQDGRPYDRPRLMGIINATPDSFSDGGAYLDPAAAVARGAALVAAGADILDVGGESTRPGATPVPLDEEIARILPVIEGLAARDDLRGTQLSIDTRHAPVMRVALSAGARIINDISALTWDADSLDVAAASDAAIVLMHMRGEPATMNLAPVYEDVALDVFDYLEARLEACIAAGIERRRLIADPGIGFGKRAPQNLAVLRSLALYHGLGVPLLLGASRKGLGDPGSERATPRQRLPSSLGAAMHALGQGVQILRVHDVAETRQIATLWERLNGPEARPDA